MAFLSLLCCVRSFQQMTRAMLSTLPPFAVMINLLATLECLFYHSAIFRVISGYLFDAVYFHAIWSVGVWRQSQALARRFQRCLFYSDKSLLHRIFMYRFDKRFRNGNKAWNVAFDLNKPTIQCWCHIVLRSVVRARILYFTYAFRTPFTVFRQGVKANRVRFQPGSPRWFCVQQYF